MTQVPETTIPAELRYGRAHAWLRLAGRTARVGISDYAQQALGEIIYVELPPVGKELQAGQAGAVVESVKAASDCVLPVSGKVTAVNGRLAAAPELVNREPYGAGWLLELELADPGELAALLDAAAYGALLNGLAPH